MKMWEADEALKEKGLSLREWVQGVAEDPEISQTDAVHLLRELTGIEVHQNSIRNWSVRFGFDWQTVAPGTRLGWPERTEELRRAVHRCLVCLMELKGLRQVDLAEACGVSRQAVHQWITGETVPPPRALDYVLAYGEEGTEDV